MCDPCRSGAQLRRGEMRHATLRRWRRLRIFDAAKSRRFARLREIDRRHSPRRMRPSTARLSRCSTCSALCRPSRRRCSRSPQARTDRHGRARSAGAHPLLPARQLLSQSRARCWKARPSSARRHSSPRAMRKLRTAMRLRAGPRLSSRVRRAAHTSSSRREGCSIASFTRTRNVTASRPSTTRWS